MMNPSRTIVLANPAAAGGRVGRAWAAITKQITDILGPVEIVRTSGPGDAAAQAESAVRAGRTSILSLGGDGTHSEVADGIRKSGAPAGTIALGILPAGTGGDFRRMLDGHDTLDGALARLRTAAATPIDLGLAHYVNESGQSESRAFLNIASFGLSAEVCRYANASAKRLGGRITYFTATIRAHRAFRGARVRLRVDGRLLDERTISTVTIANGRFAGGGMIFAPGARLADGQIDLTAIEHRSFLRTVALAPKMYGGRILEGPGIEGAQGAVIEAEPVGDEVVGVELDGDVRGRLPARFEVRAGAIRLYSAGSLSAAASSASQS